MISSKFSIILTPFLINRLLISLQNLNFNFKNNNNELIRRLKSNMFLHLHEGVLCKNTSLLIKKMDQTLLPRMEQLRGGGLDDLQIKSS